MLEIDRSTEGKRVYIGGPMTGHYAYNAPAFYHAQRVWKQHGYDSRIPFEANDIVWQRHHGKTFNPHVDKCDYGDPLIPEIILEDLKLLATCKLAAFLPGWENSKGSANEISFANIVGIPCVSALDGKPLLSGAPKQTTPETVTQEAHRIVYGARGADYGHPVHDFTRTGRMWAPILGLDTVSPRQVALCMVAVKISRECNKPKRDNWVDIAGYAETGDMCRQYAEQDLQTRAADAALDVGKAGA